MTYRTILFDIASNVATLRLNRPQALNAITLEMVNEITHVLDRLEQDRGARALLIAGEGKGFSSGIDLAGGSGANREGALDAGRVLELGLNPLMQKLARLPIPIIAAVHGPVVGAGVSLALAADIVIASRSAYFLLAFAKVGLIPDAGITWLLPRLIGSARAQAMMLLAERVPAEDAAQWGMIHACVDDDVLAESAHTKAAALAAGPTVALGLIRQAVRESLSASYNDALSSERFSQKRAGSTRDFAEGVTAFREKRLPSFQGL